jgi:7,8-dihydroneopterin aldolase/epimerase/oxygenase
VSWLDELEDASSDERDGPQPAEESKDPVSEASSSVAHAAEATGAAVDDVIEVRGLRVFGTHGVLDAERHTLQPFEIDLRMVVDMARAATSDALADTADYAAAIDAAAAVITGPTHVLLESLADDIAQAILRDRRVKAVTVALRKMRPPVAHDLESAGVRLTRRRP